MAATAIFAFVISWQAYDILWTAPRFAGGQFLIVPALIFIFAGRRYLFSMWGIANR